jgi:TIR domain
MRYQFDAFLSYAREDIATATLVAERLTAAGAKVFFDKHDLRAGEAWKLAIPKAIRQSKTFIAFLSRASVRKMGYVQDEILQALEVVRSLPPDRIFVIPLRLEPCKPRHPMLHQFTWVDLFDGLEEAIIRILRVVKPRAARSAEARHIEAIAPPPRTTAPVTDGALALTKLPSTEAQVQKRLDILSASSAVAHRVVSNLLAESNLPNATVLELVNAISASPAEASAVRQAIQRVCRAHILQGPPAVLEPQAPLTRVISLDTFAALLVQSGFVSSTSVAHALIEQVVDQESPSRRWPTGMPLGRHIIWALATALGQPSPLELLASQQNVLDVLGLPSHRAGEPLLAISYRLPPHIIPRIPTFCDAYAGEFWPYLFHVAPPGAHYGLTVPRDETGRLAGLPEVVHHPISLDQADSVRVIA